MKLKKHLILLLATLFVSAHLALAQDSTASSNHKTVVMKHASGYKTTSLHLGGALGYGVYRDLGTAPIRFKGLITQPALGLEFGGMRRWTTTIDALTSVGAFEDAVPPTLNFGSYNISNILRFKMRKQLTTLWALESESKLYCFNDDKYPLGNKKHFAAFSAAFGAANIFDITVNPEYENASAGVTELFGPELSLRADFFLNTIFNWFDFEKADKQLHTEFGFMPVAAVMRPGYSYIDNYTSTQPVISALFDEYDWHLKPFAGLYTDIGIDFISTFSRVSLSYVWAYYSSGNNGASRFDHASHYLALDFIIPLKTRRVCTSRAIPVD